MYHSHTWLLKTEQEQNTLDLKYKWKQEQIKFILNLTDTMHASETAIEAVMVDLICLIRASSMEEKLFIVFMLVFNFQFLVSPKCTVLDSFNLKAKINI